MGTSGALTYVRADVAINIANQIFGHDGWSTELKSLTTQNKTKTAAGKWDVTVQATMRVTPRASGTWHEDVGIGNSENSPKLSQAIEKATKEAATDAMKRALRKLGNATGSCITIQNTTWGYTG
ncbi:dsRNA-binding domain-like protein [Tuber magnatum]|uniref:DsRNA-binding domain-like protein n=1 Tax=Tuber magnatum TaxID=42249 RepID=A0A317SIH8_9PEZI|nr:dsRNA-binding domain-like protein [Tuber magnatum]